MRKFMNFTHNDSNCLKIFSTKGLHRHNHPAIYFCKK